MTTMTCGEATECLKTKIASDPDPLAQHMLHGMMDMLTAIFDPEDQIPEKLLTIYPEVFTTPVTA